MGQQTPSSVTATTLNLQGNVDPSHLQIAGRGNHRRGTPTEMLSVPSLHRPKDFRLGRGESGHRPLFPQPSHSLPHLQDVHSLEAEELGPQRRPLHLHQLRGTIHRVWAPTPQADHSDLPQLQGQEIPPTIAAVSTTPPMVDPETEPGSPVPMSIPPPNITIWTDASKTGWGGGIFSGIHGQWRLVPRGEPLPHQHPGMSGSNTLSPQTGPSKGLSYPGEDRQHGSGVPYKQARIKQKQGPVSLPARAPSIVRAEQMDDPIEAPTRPPQHMGRLPLSQSPSESGVVPVSTELPTAKNTPQSRDRPLRSPGKRQAAGLRMPIPVPLSHSGRRPSHELEQVEEDLSLPPSRPDSTLPPKTRRLRRLRAGHRSSTSFRSLVARVPSRLHPTRRRPRHRAMGARRVAESSRENVISLSRFQFLKDLYSLRYEAPVALALSNAHRGSTRDQYEHCWKDFQRWLTSIPTKPISKGSVLLYLNHLAQTRELSPKTVLVYRNALKLPLLHGFNIDTSDREFSLLARSQFLQNPPPKKLIPAWNPNKVLSMLEQPEFLNHRATPHRLLMKTLFLVALATGNRVSEIASFTRVGSKILPGSKKKKKKKPSLRSDLVSFIKIKPWTAHPPTLSSRHCWTRT